MMQTSLIGESLVQKKKKTTQPRGLEEEWSEECEQKTEPGPTLQPTQRTPPGQHPQADPLPAPHTESAPQSRPQTRKSGRILPLSQVPGRARWPGWRSKTADKIHVGLQQIIRVRRHASKYSPGGKKKKKLQTEKTQPWFGGGCLARDLTRWEGVICLGGSVELVCKVVIPLLLERGEGGGGGANMYGLGCEC